MPRYGISCSRATGRRGSSPPSRASRSRPGTSTPSACSSSRTASSYDMFSASTQRTWTRQPRVDAGVLERLVHREVRVVELHVLADERDLDVLAQLARALDELAPLTELGRAGIEPELLADERVETLGLEHLGDEVDVGHVRAIRSRRGGRRRRRARSSRGCRRRAAPSSGRRRCRGGCRCGAAR